MGNTRSAPDPEEEEDIFWNTKNEETSSDRQKRLKEELDEFKLELARKHEKRRQLIAEKRREMEELCREVANLKQENEDLKSGKLQSPPNDLEDIKQKNHELKIEIATLQKDLQDLNSEVINFEQERQDYKAHVVALKDVVSVSKQMLMIREAQLKEMRDKVKEIEATLAGKELKILSQDLKEEYEKQLQNIRNLRVFYEERQRADIKEKEEMRGVIEEVKKELVEEQEKNRELNENLQRLEEENSKKYDEIKSLESTLGLTRAECRQYQAELSVINQLFSQILLGFNNNQEIDIDKLIKLLEENHHLLQDIAVKEESNQVSALPKVLLDLVSEVSDSKKVEDAEEAAKINPQLNSASEIVENLPKVWKVLIELLSHQSAPSIEEQKNQNPCHKLVETPKGPQLVLSVSQTFIRLKDLILEKKSLERETNKLKHLNAHLECRLQEQEKRLEFVSHELSETWHVVGKLQKKHQLLHTQEKILRYELAQKRKLLTDLKVELEYSREKWQEAREKNSKTAKQWEQLRIEFASRKSGGGDDSNNSVESGYSDDKDSSEDEPGYETEEGECLMAANGEAEILEEGETSGLGEETDASEEKTVDSPLTPQEERLLDALNEKYERKGVEGKKTDDKPLTPQEDSLLDAKDKKEGERGEGKTLKSLMAAKGEADTLEEGETSGLGEETDTSEEKTVDSPLTPQEERLLDALNEKYERKGVEGVKTDDNPLTPQEDSLLDAKYKEEGGSSGGKTLDDVLKTREERLQRMENQCSSLVKQVTNTSSSGEAITNQLVSLHEKYGEGTVVENAGEEKTVENNPLTEQEERLLEALNDKYERREEKTDDSRLTPQEERLLDELNEKYEGKEKEGVEKTTVEGGEEGNNGKKTIDDMLKTREERLKRMETQCSSLVKQVTNTSSRGKAIANKLDALHQVYGEGETSGLRAETEEGGSEKGVAN